MSKDTGEKVENFFETLVFGLSDVLERSLFGDSEEWKQESSENWSESFGTPVDEVIEWATR